MEDGTMMDSAMPTMEDGTIAEKEVMMDEMMDGKGMMGEKTGTKTFNMTGKMFAFSETEMRVKKGDKVTVNFESTEGLHDWVVDEFNARTKQVQPGTKTSVTFTADKTGTFEYYCAVGKHRQMGMVGKLIVE
jgi:plastocyanin